MAIVVIRVRVPGLIIFITGVINGYETHSIFDQSTGQQTRAGKGSVAVDFADRFRFAADIESLHGLLLHLKRGFHGLDLTLQFAVALTALEVSVIQLLQDVQLFALLFSVELWIVNVGDKFFDLHISGDDAGRLKFRRQEAVAPESGAYHNFGAGPQNDVAWKIFVLGAEAVK